MTDIDKQIIDIRKDLAEGFDLIHETFVDAYKNFQSISVATAKNFEIINGIIKRMMKHFEGVTDANREALVQYREQQRLREVATLTTIVELTRRLDLLESK